MREDTVKKIIFDFLVVVAESVLAFAVLGTIFARDMQITYAYFFLPLVLSVIYMLPCITLYVKEDLTIGQIIFQRIAEWIVIEIITEIIIYKIIGDKMPIAGYVGVGIAIFVLDFVSYITSYIFEKKNTELINNIIMENKKSGKRTDDNIEEIEKQEE